MRRFDSREQPSSGVEARSTSSDYDGATFAQDFCGIPPPVLPAEPTTLHQLAGVARSQGATRNGFTLSSCKCSNTQPNATLDTAAPP